MRKYLLSFPVYGIYAILVLVLILFSGLKAFSLEPIKTRPDMVVLIPNGGVVMVYRDKWGTIITEDYYSVRVSDQGIGLCDDVGKGDLWLFTGGGFLLHKEEVFPKGITPYWRHLEKDESYLHNEKSTRPRK